MSATAATRISIAEVALDARSAGSEATFTYRNDGGAHPGDLVLVPLGPRQALGIVESVGEKTADELPFPVAHLRAIQGVVERFELPAATMELLRFVQDEYLASISQAMTAALPPGLKDRLATKWQLADQAPAPQLNAAQQEILAVLRDKGSITESKSNPLLAGTRKLLRGLEKMGLVEQHLSLSTGQERRRLGGQLRLSSDHAAVEQYLIRHGKRRPAQAMTLMRLQGSESTSFSPQEIKALCGCTDATLKTLLEAGMLVEVAGPEASLGSAPTPNPAQAAASERITEAIHARRHETFLLYGVTGSGKTEVYLRCAAAALKAGRQVLYLVPEIALTAQVIAQLRDRFGRNVAVMHSGMAPQERLESWSRVQSGEAPIVLGPRSALFAPLTNIGLIVQDEEHETSYKQETSPRYHARVLARKLAEIHHAALVLGSATPSLETMYEARQGSICLLELPQRAAAASTLPDVQIQDLREVYAGGRARIFSDALLAELQTTLDRRQQAMLFLNRRAFAPFLACRTCGHSFECPRCTVSLSYHKRDRRLRCHHCGFESLAPETCPVCEGTRIAPFGLGVERLEEAVIEAFPTARVVRIDRDIARRRGALEETFATFRSGGADILVGTQMIAKGLDFPNVTLVGVVAADISLNLPDFRAEERTFQLLSQVAGRAGRRQERGRVIIQTMNPTNRAVEHARDHDYKAFFDGLIDERRALAYPPFNRLVNIVASGTSKKAVQDAIDAIARQARERLDASALLGPASCPIERLDEKWRFHLLVKLPFNVSPGDFYAGIQVREVPGVQVVFDVDAQSLM